MIPFGPHSSNEIIDVYNGSRPSAGIEFFPNPAYGDKEALKVKPDYMAAS